MRVVPAGSELTSPFADPDRIARISSAALGGLFAEFAEADAPAPPARAAA